MAWTDVEKSTPWLVTRRRTCPICKGDVVRQIGNVDVAPAQANSMTEDEVQEQAAQTRNESTNAERPVPISTATVLEIDHDLERGEGQT